MKSQYLLFILTICVFMACSHKPTSKPNLILIQADDLGYCDLAVHGNKYVETPALDHMAKSGIQFNNFYVNSVCAPTRASLLTGRHFLRTGVSHVHGGKDFIHLEEKLLPETLKENGYVTGMWGKWHSGKTHGYFPWERGFDEAYMAQLYKHEKSQGELNGITVKHDKWASEVVTDYAVNFMRKNKEHTFFAYLSHLTVHAPLKAPQYLISKYQDKGLSKNLATIYAMVEQMDSCIQVLVDEVDSLGLSENTIFIFLSDNGPAVINHLLNDGDRKIRYVNQYKGHKGNLWENGVKSPLFVNWNNVTKPGVSKQLLDVTDLYPTLVKLAGGKFPEKQKMLDGIDFSGIIKGGKDKLAKTVFNWVNPGWPPSDKPWSPEGIQGEYQPVNAENKTDIRIQAQLMSMRTSDIKLLQNPGKSSGTVAPENGYVLIDMKKDSKETINLFSESSNMQEKTVLQDWFDDILGSAYSFSSPVFQIDKKSSIVLAYAPQKITEGLTNTSFYLKGWERGQMEAEYYINIQEEGKYAIELEFIESLNKPVSFGIETKHTNLVDVCEGKTGTLGIIKLDKGQQVLKLTSLDENQQQEIKLSTIRVIYK